MVHLRVSPSRSFFLSTLYATVFSVASLNGEISWSMESPKTNINLTMGPEEMMEALISTLPENQHIGAYLESMGPCDPRYGIMYASFEIELARKNKITLQDWKRQPIFEMVNALGLRSPFLMPGLMQALKNNKTIQIMDVSGITLTDVDEECITDILEANKQIILIRDHDDFQNSEVINDRSESLKTAMDEHSEFFYPSLKIAMDTLEHLNLDIWMSTNLMIDAKSQGITSPFLLPGFVRALRENKTIKTIDCRGYNLTNLESDYIDQILSVRKEIKVLKDPDLVSSSPKNNSDISLKSKGKKPNNPESASIDMSTPQNYLTSFQNKTFPSTDDSLEDLERSFKNNEIDIDTYEMLKKELSPQVLPTPVAEDSRNCYQAHKSLFDSMDCLNLKVIMNVGMMAGLESVGITSIFMFPDFVRALQDNKTIKTIDIRDYPITEFELDQINQVLSVNKNIKLMPDINLSEIIAKGESSLKSTGKKYQKLESPLTKINSPKISLTKFLDVSSLPTNGDSLADLERSFRNKEIDKGTYEMIYEMLKNEFSPQRLAAPVESKIESKNITNKLNTNRKSTLLTQETETSIEEIVHGEGAKLKSKLKGDYENGKIDLDTYNLWIGQVDKVKLEGQTNKEQILEEGALDIQRVCIEEKNRELNYQGINVNENFILDVLIRLIRMDTFLTHLNFSNCQIDDLGAILLVEALKINKTILHLDLRNNKIGTLGAQAFANLFGSICILERKPCFNDTLKTLQLEGNPIHSEMLRRILRGIKVSKLTKELDEDQKSPISINIIEIAAK